MEIGAQQLNATVTSSRELLERLGRHFGAKGPCPVPESPPPAGSASRTLDPAAPFARDFWGWLGFEYAAIDVDGSPGSLPLDLNLAEVPAESRAKFDLVTNFGTTEHVINQMNAFAVIHDLVKPGGLMLHNLPAQGHFNHGLVNYTPKFFWALARSNGYRWLHVNFFWEQPGYAFPENFLEQLREYVPDVDQRLQGWQTFDCSIAVVFQKVLDAPFVVPTDADPDWSRVGRSADVTAGRRSKD